MVFVLSFVPQVGIEPTRLAAHEFESCASTSSATAAVELLQSLVELDCEFINIFHTALMELNFRHW